MGKSHNFSVRVYYEDTDFSGNVYHAAYLKFLERGRTEFLRAEGVHHSELAKEGLAFAVRSMQIGFEAPAHIDDLLDIETEVMGLSGARLSLKQTIRRRETLIAGAQVLVVAIKTSGAPARIPQVIRTRFAGTG